MTIKKFKLFNIKLASSRLIDQTLEKNNIRRSVLDLASRIKKALKIIQKYHVCKKRIIFIGNPFYINKQLTTILKKSKHIFIPRFAWVAGHISNRFTRSKKLRNGYNQTKLYSIHKLKKKSSLVVIIDELREPIALNEHHKAKLPVITLNSQTNMLDEPSIFKIPAKLVTIKSNINLSLFYSLLIVVLKESATKKYKHYRQYVTRKKPKKIRYYKFKKSHHYYSKNKEFTQKANKNFFSPKITTVLPKNSDSK